MSFRKVLLSITENSLFEIVVTWTASKVLREGEHLSILCFVSQSPTARTEQDITSALAISQKRISKILERIEQLKRNYSLRIVKEWNAISETTLHTINALNPRKLVLFIDIVENWVTKLLMGSVIESIRDKANVETTILTSDLMKRMQDMDVFGLSF